MPTFDAGPGPLHLIASFDDPVTARESMVDLEAAGIDAAAVRLVDRPPARRVPTAEGSGDRVAAGDVAKRSMVGVVLGAIVGAALLMLVVSVAGLRPLSVALPAGALAGGLFGGALGGFWAGASRLPVNTDALDTYTLGSAPGHPVTVEVHLADPDLVDRAEQVFQRHHARAVDRAA
ncbi:MAG: hypothetical protein JWN46_3965 [Acidimicrobiales bacterium]|nr:hypothetical protein [Acidimicrobiales bacterium]